MATSYKDIEYWRERHIKYRGDIRSVGRVDLSSADNISSSKTLSSALADISSSIEPQTVLDLGCGIGRFAETFECQYHGVDASEEALKQAISAHPSGRFTLCDLANYPAKRKYDLVLAAFVFVHLVDEERWKDVLSAFCNSIGRIGLIMDTMPLSRHQKAGHVMERSRSEYDIALRAHNMAFSDPLQQRFAHLPNAGTLHFVQPISDLG